MSVVVRRPDGGHDVWPFAERFRLQGDGSITVHDHGTDTLAAYGPAGWHRVHSADLPKATCADLDALLRVESAATAVAGFLVATAHDDDTEVAEVWPAIRDLVEAVLGRQPHLHPGDGSDPPPGYGSSLAATTIEP